MAHKQNRHLSASSRAKISAKLRADEAVKSAEREARKEEREIERAEHKAALAEIRELKHLQHERNVHAPLSGAEKERIANSARETEHADATENSARAENRYRHELETRTYRPPHRRNRH